MAQHFAGVVNGLAVTHEARPAFDKRAEELGLELLLALRCQAFVDLAPECGEDYDVLVVLRPAKFFEFSQISGGLATELRVGYPVEVDEAIQLSVVVISSQFSEYQATNQRIEILGINVIVEQIIGDLLQDIHIRHSGM